MKVLNLYAGLCGNRKLWQDVEVTNVELNPKIAAIGKRLHPDDKWIVGDAHQYLLEHFEEFDFIWISRPCQSHTRMMKFTRHKKALKYPDFGLYEEIVLLKEHFKGKWVVENVKPYYEPLIKPSKQIGRHLFWSNFPIPDITPPVPPDNFINLTTVSGKKVLMDWLDIHFEENVYYEGNHCPAQILRNCVHPKIGLEIFKAIESI